LTGFFLEHSRLNFGPQSHPENSLTPFPPYSPSRAKRGVFQPTGSLFPDPLSLRPPLRVSFFPWAPFFLFFLSYCCPTCPSLSPKTDFPPPPVYFYPMLSVFLLRIPLYLPGSPTFVRRGEILPPIDVILFCLPSLSPALPPPSCFTWCRACSLPSFFSFPRFSPPCFVSVDTKIKSVSSYPLTEPGLSLTFFIVSFRIPLSTLDIALQSPWH